MDCRHIRRDMPALLDSDLPPRRTVEVERHLDGCPDCSAALAEFKALLDTCDGALAYRGEPLSFDRLRPRLATIEPLEEVIRYRLPKLRIPGTAPRFAVAMALLVSMAGLSYACRHSREVYTAAKTPFANQKATVTAALEDERFPWDEQPAAGATRDRDRDA